MLSHKLRPYKGKVLEPKLMTTQSLKAYRKWWSEHLEWSLKQGTHPTVYNRMALEMEPYIAELEKRMAKPSLWKN